MAGFEVVVRPVVFPDIRPRAKPSLPPEDDPTKGFAVIQGNPAQVLGLAYSLSISSSHSRPTETKRRVDEVRVHQMDDEGNVDEDTYVDLQVTNKMWMNEPEGGGKGPSTAAPSGGSNYQPSSGGALTRQNYYKRVEESPNIEILKKDKIIKQQDQG